MSTDQTPKKFSDIKADLLNALLARSKDLNINEQVSLIDGFINLPLQEEFTGGLVLGGSSLPIVACV
ncbi:MAG TPA: hypothetical protein PK765_06230 [bacterium]|nr:hypothetical protein [bacterium]